MNFLKKLALFNFLAFSFVFGANLAQAQGVPLNIAVVDIEYVLHNAKASQSIRQQVKNTRESYRTQIQKDEADLRKANQDLAQKKALLSSDAFKEERRKFEQRVLDVQKKVQEKNINLQKQQNQAAEKVKDALKKVVLDISSKKGFTLVIRRAQTIVVADNFDITKEVLTALDASLPDVKVFN